MTVTTILLLCAMLAMPPVALFALEIACAFLARPNGEPGEAPAFTVLIPAHDEQAVIAATLSALLPQLRAGDRLLVVADNCSDDTAAIARAMGAEVTERVDADLRGKGYALAHGVAHARQWTNPVIIVVDADCHVESGALSRLAADVARTGRPVQGSYLITAPAQGRLAMRFSAFAIRVKNHVRLLGCHALGVPCILTGSGMAFPSDTLDSIPIASGEIVEDLLLGIDLARAGHPPVFSPQARIASPLPLDGKAAEIQRARWESGYMSIMRRFVLPLLLEGLRRRKLGLILLGLDIAIPPLSLLCMLLAVLCALSGLWWLAGGGVAPLALLSGMIALFGGAILLAWAGYGRDLLTLREMVLMPVSVLKKMGFYFRLALGPKRGWVRTARDGE
ncbi:glycosyltransferase family 2 protein [Sphingobium chlorophenolicum]|uniref:Glycosyl transferase family 2 n=1 Tax=Sphingobium chlorophenolicum TaxID=46429 RepID=A0A081RGD6_SPHCR|nr:glycosyltransferase family 2 protein [Sphingobium chlorophenolicum]KEQ54259.1 Glycosyl transferase family 2 precursor [Sphingobium chlorophenolicum]